MTAIEAFARSDGIVGANRYFRAMESRSVAKSSRFAAMRSREPVPIKRTTPWTPGMYQEYLQSREWAMKRLALFKARGRKCESCGLKDNVTVHHLSYAKLGAEPDDHLVILCWPCHEKRHDDQIARKAAKARGGKA